jgi:hypothetical protein
MEDFPILAAIFGSEELLQYSDELIETMAHLRGRRLNMDTKKVIEEVNKFKIHRKKNNKNLKTKINIERSKFSKLKKEVNKCLKTCLTKKIKHNKKSSKNKTHRRKK